MVFCGRCSPQSTTEFKEECNPTTSIGEQSYAMTSPLKILETDRLILRRLSVEDAEFILSLLNEPSFLLYIGDKGVRTIAGARDYILQGPIHSYERFGFGLYLAELKDDGTPIGICGLLKREALADVDIGFAFLPQFWKKGYAFESASAVLSYGKDALGLKRIVAITDSDNKGSINVLGKLGLRFERMIRMSEDAPEIMLFVSDG
jgi:RimJ/RimL family protein N-acetyltransferase